MCESCGCLNIDVIAELTAEHDRLRELGRHLQDATASGDLPAARATADAMRAILAPHTTVEERGLFPLLAGDYPDQMDALTADHRTIDEALSTIADAPDWQHIALAAVDSLFEHILREQDGDFPAALATLTADGWDEIATVRRRAGRRSPEGDGGCHFVDLVNSAGIPQEIRYRS